MTRSVVEKVDLVGTAEVGGLKRLDWSERCILRFIGPEWLCDDRAGGSDSLRAEGACLSIRGGLEDG